MSKSKYKEYLKAGHYCVSCQLQDARTLNGRALCFDCLDKANARSDEYRRANKAEINKKQAETRAKRAINGQCPECGKKLPNIGYKYKLCCDCRARARKKEERKRRERGALTVQDRFARTDVCVKCGEPLGGVTLAWSGEPSRYCRVCYEKARESLIKARAANAEKHGGRTYGQRRYQYEHPTVDTRGKGAQVRGGNDA